MKREILKELGPPLRAAGFRGSGQNYRKSEGDFVFLINFQGSDTGEGFYINLGAHPVFMPSESGAELGRLKVYECFLRRRVGERWSWQISDQQVGALEAELLSAQAEFFARAQTMRAALATDPPLVLLEKFCAGQTRAGAALSLSHAALALGHRDQAHALARFGLEIAPEGASGLRAMLRAAISRRGTPG